ncbi:GmrSD restriction endonuclease domain-containing protein [Micromonospora haikouensis]|uniref:GmrSD restriction endonuclease domain-containing protein n=1 Tax=Micromonospora haikouensis TaxID=686309 RepID=UPI003787430C
MPEAPIRGDGFTVQGLFSTFQFRLDSFQREYSWGRQDVKALISDLAGHFIRQWSPGQERREVRNFEPYFLGPFVYYRDDEFAALVDGQQRITTLHLLMVHLRRLAAEADRPEYGNDIGALDPLIAGTSYGERAYAIDEPERIPLLESLLDGNPYSLPAEASPSVVNLYERSQEIDELLPESIRDEALPLFIHWLLNRVCLVGIDAVNRRQGWAIFETMNDRGVQLGPADLLKSFLLRRADNVSNRARLGETWRSMLTRLHAVGAQATTRFLQALLVGKYAIDQADVTDIGISFHGWVQLHAENRLGLVYPSEFARFIECELPALSRRFVTLAGASERPDQGLESVFYNAANEIEQMPFLLAVLQSDDTDAQFREKARLVADFLDLTYVQRLINNGDDRPNVVSPEFLEMLRELRDCRDLDQIKKLLGNQTVALDTSFSAVRQYGLRPDNRAQVRYLLARMTAFVEVGSGRPDQMARYLDNAEPYEIEHIWANKFDRYQAEVKTEDKFRIQRNRLGALLLLQKSHNASYQASPYEEKVEWYRGQNNLAASLHRVNHQRNRPFTDGVVKKHGLEKLFRPFDKFDVIAIDTRQLLYQRLCELIWDPQRLGFTVPRALLPEQATVRAVAHRTRAHYGAITVARLVEANALRVGEELTLVYKQIRHTARINPAGQIELAGGERFDSPSPAGTAVTGKRTMNGWSYWKVERSGKAVTLFDVRSDALERGILEAEERDLEQPGPNSLVEQTMT